MWPVKAFKQFWYHFDIALLLFGHFLLLCNKMFEAHPELSRTQNLHQLFLKMSWFLSVEFATEKNICIICLLLLRYHWSYCFHSTAKASYLDRNRQTGRHRYVLIAYWQFQFQTNNAVFFLTFLITYVSLFSYIKTLVLFSIKTFISCQTIHTKIWHPFHYL